MNQIDGIATYTLAPSTRGPTYMVANNPLMINRTSVEWANSGRNFFYSGDEKVQFSKNRVSLFLLGSLKVRKRAPLSRK
jgi:hypothetical protein